MRVRIAVGGLVVAMATTVALEVGGLDQSRRHAPGPLLVAGRFAVDFAGWDGLGAAAHFADLVTPELLGRLVAPPGASGPAPASVILHSVVSDDAGPDDAGVAASVAVDGSLRALDMHLVRSPAGWRVDAVEP